MDRFHLYEKIYLSGQLTAAYEDACRKLGINPLRRSADAEPHQLVRDQVARALLNAAQHGECNTSVLSGLAVAFGMRNWHLTKQ
jgi:hypothetical protein